MIIGMYTRELKCASIEALFEKIRALGFNAVQFDFQSVPEIGEELPLQIDPSILDRIRNAAEANHVVIRALNGTFNMCTHNPEMRRDNIRRFETLAKACRTLNCGMITLCTGSRNIGYPNRWRSHPDNDLQEAWDDVIWSAKAISPIAKKHGILLGIEIESTLVVGTPEKALRFFEELGDDADQFGVIFDASNLYKDGLQSYDSLIELMDRTFEMMGNKVVLAHGKDLLYGGGLSQNGCGLGMLDYDHYLEEFKKIGYNDTMIIHGIKREEDFAYCSNFMRQKLQLHGMC